MNDLHLLWQEWLQEVREVVEQVNAIAFHHNQPPETVALEDMNQGMMITSRILTALCYMLLLL